MRTARLKPMDIPMFYHLYNRVAGEPGYRPFGEAEKEKFVQLLHKLDAFFCVKVVSYQVMDNHFHLVAHAPDKPPEVDEVCQRYTAYYGPRHTLDPSDPYCRVLAERMRDISWFMRLLQQQFSTWFNKTRPTPRRGTIWAGRFKHTLLGDGRAAWECCKYVEMNAVRAGMADNPADYRFGSFGVWSQAGYHPFEHNVRDVLLPWIEGIYPFENTGQLHRSWSDTFAELTGVEVEPDGKVAAFCTRIDRRVRYWTDGLVIGSELFLTEMTGRYGHILRPKQRGWNRARGADDRPSALYCCKRLRSI